MVANQQGGLRQDEFAKGIQIGVDFFVFPPRQIGHVGHHGHIRIVGADLGNGTQVFWGATKAHFDDAHIHVFQHGAGLLSHGFVIKRNMVKDFGGVTQISASDHSQRMHAN